jgi:hypothetical protein
MQINIGRNKVQIPLRAKRSQEHDQPY